MIIANLKWLTLFIYKHTILSTTNINMKTVMYHRTTIQSLLFLGGICFFAANNVHAQSLKSTVSASDPYGIDFSQLSGNVDSVSEYRGDALDDMTIYSLITYDGNTISKTVQYDDNGAVRLYTVYTYDGKNQLTSITGTDRNNAQRWKYQYTYDSSGKQTEEKSLDASNMLEWRVESQYTASGKLKKRITYDAGDNITLTETFQYNDRGFISADITQYPDGKLLKRIIYTYTKGGHIAQEDHYDSTGFFERIGYSYTEGGDIVSFSNISKDYSINSRTTLKYGTQGKITTQTITAKDKSVTSIQYVYDERGNWIWKYDNKMYALRKIVYEE